MKPTNILLPTIILGTFFCQVGWAQGLNNMRKDSARQAFTATNTKYNEQVFLAVGSQVKYKKRSANDFVAGTIRGGSDSTITFTDRKAGSTIVLLRDLGAIKIQRSKGRRTAGTTLAIIGSVGTLVGVVGVATHNTTPSNGSGVQETENTAALIIGAVGVPILIGGIALRSSRKLDFARGFWRLDGGVNHSK